MHVTLVALEMQGFILKMVPGVKLSILSSINISSYDHYINDTFITTYL